MSGSLDVRRAWRFLTQNATIVAGLSLALFVFVLVIRISDPSVGTFASAQDARSYHGLDFANPYVGRPAWGEIGAFPYSPAFAQLVWPLGLLPWPFFVATWTALLLACVAWLSGRELLILGVAIAAAEIMGGNISLLLAAAIVLGFRWPAAWSFVLLTKITPGVGLLWFLVRREWRALAIALGATSAVVAISFALSPTAWPAWIDFLQGNTSSSGTWASLPVPLVVRLPLAVLLVVWGAKQGFRWTVPVAAMLALPALWYGAIGMLLAVIPLSDRREVSRARAALADLAGRVEGQVHPVARELSRLRADPKTIVKLPDRIATRLRGEGP